MAATIAPPTIILPVGFDERQEFETVARGYLSHVIVQLENGNRYPLFFYDPVRLQQDLEERVKVGKSYLGEPNVVILPELTMENVRRAVHGLWQEGYFQHLKPL